MSATKCNSLNCNRKSDAANTQNMCVLCFDWFQKCQDQSQLYQQQNAPNYQELVNIFNNLSNGIHVDQNVMMRALIGSMINVMNQNSQIIGLKDENVSLKASVKNLEEELDANKVKVSIIEYNLKSFENEEFLPTDSIVIRNLDVPADGDELCAVRNALAQINVEGFDPTDDILKVERKGNRNGKLGSIFVKIGDREKKKKLMKKKKELTNSSDPKLKELKIMNFKTQEQIIFENALRGVLAIVPDGSQYELNGNMRLVPKQS